MDGCRKGPPVGNPATDQLVIGVSRSFSFLAFATPVYEFDSALSAGWRLPALLIDGSLLLLGCSSLLDVDSAKVSPAFSFPPTSIASR